jgi:hypothetical protein
MISFVLPLILHAAPAGPLDVVVARRIEMPAARAARLASGLGRALVRAGVEQVRGPESNRNALSQVSTERCKNDRRCLSDLARSAGSRVLVGLDVGMVLDQASFGMVAFVPGDETPLLRETFTVSVTETDAAVDLQFDAFATKLARTLSQAPAHDAPLTRSGGSLLPRGSQQQEPSTAVVREPGEEPRSVALPVAVSVAAAGGAGATGWFLVSAQQSELALRATEFQSSQGPASTLTRAEAEAHVAAANQTYMVAAATGAATALLVSWAVWLWTAD